MKPKTIIFIILGILILIFLVQNTQIVSVQFLFWNFQMSRIILIALILLVGLILGFIIAEVRRKR